MEGAKARPGRRLRSTTLNREQAVYDASLPQWVQEHDSAHVLIKDDEVVGFYPTREEALAAGYSRFGVVPLFVKKITAAEPVYYIPNVTL